MIWEWIPTNSAVKKAGWIAVLFDWAEVEDPKVLAVSAFKKLLGILATVAVHALDARGWIAHDDDPVGDVDKIWRE